MFTNTAISTPPCHRNPIQNWGGFESITNLPNPLDPLCTLDKLC